MREAEIHNVHTQGFMAGMYLVNVIADGKVIDKHKLIIELWLKWAQTSTLFVPT